MEAGLVRIETRLIPSETIAGSPVKVQCVGVYEDTREEVLEGDLASYTVHPSEAVSVMGDTVKSVLEKM